MTTNSDQPDPFDIRPFVIVHLGVTLNGRVWSGNPDSQVPSEARDIYGQALEAFQADATIYSSNETGMEVTVLGGPETSQVVPLEAKTVTELDLALRDLKSGSNIDALVVQGDGRQANLFLEAGLVDELSLLIAPLVSTQEEGPELFQDPTLPTQLNLVHAQAFDAGLLWTRYQQVAD